MILQGMYGLGDNIYQRAVVRELGAVSLLTPWPQLYADLPVECIRPVTSLRTQAKNAARPDLQFSERASARGSVRRFGYGREGTIVESLLQSAGIKRDRLDFSGPPVKRAAYEPYILIRPATIRQEWRADSRNPDPAYLARAADALRDRYTIISVADLKPGVEWAVDPLPFAHVRYHAGELSLEYLLSLVAGAAGVVGGVGWLLPAAVAYRTPLLLVYGGWGASNGPQRVLDRRMPTDDVVQAIPSPFCMCDNRAHDCNKTIGDFDATLDKFAARLRC